MAFEEKKPLAGWLYMIVGIAIMGYSQFIQAKAPGSKIGIFFWVGIVFLVFGIIKEVAPRIGAKRPVKERVGPPPSREHVATQQHPAGQRFEGVSPHATHQHTAPQQHPSHPYQPMHKQCPRCQQLTHGQGKFCHNCGYQFY